MMRRILLLGGASELGLAVVAELLADGSAAQTEVVLAGRPSSRHRQPAVAQIEALGAAAVHWLDFDAAAAASHPAVIAAGFERPVDVAIVAFGLLGASDSWRDQELTVQLAQTNFTGALSVGSLVAGRFAAQGRGQLIAISSMAGERVRRANLVYGATKAGFDGFFLQLGVELAAAGVQVLVVRPGTVLGRMTARASAPLSTTPAKVAQATVRALRAGRPLVRVPTIFNLISVVYRNLPAWLVNRLPF